MGHKYVYEKGPKVVHPKPLPCRKHGEETVEVIAPCVGTYTIPICIHCGEEAA